MSKIDELRDKTYYETKDLLAKYHRCAIIRPTGFGKTGLLTRLIADYQSVLYLYPADVIWETVLNFNNNVFNRGNDESIDGVINWTYQMLATADDERLSELANVELIIADECHRLGGRRTSIAFRRLIEEICPNADVVGATATPERMDLVDEITDFFQNHVVSKYTIHDAFVDDIVKRPYYCFCSVDYKQDFEKIKKMTNEEIEKLDDMEDKLIQQHKLNEHLKEISELVRMPNIIRTTCDECLDDTSYMKFIVFCANIEHIGLSFDEVCRWFSKAYPNHNVRTLTISSENNETHKNVFKLKELVKAEDTIDLIFSCDMLNMGYHIEDLTGIVMYRTTNSGIIYAQQLGRVINSGCDKSGIVFDVVDNIHRRSLYEVMGQPSLKTLEEQQLLKHYNDRIAKTESAGYEYGDLTNVEIEEYLALSMKYSDSDVHGRRSRYEGLTSTDLIVTAFSATYDELIKKTVAEPIAMRCRQTYEYWVRSGGRTDGEYAGIAGVLLQEKKARAINYGYCNNAESTCVPITPFAKIKQVSVQCVLETIFGKNVVASYQHVIDEVMSNTLPRVREKV